MFAKLRLTLVNGNRIWRFLNCRISENTLVSMRVKLNKRSKSPQMSNSFKATFSPLTNTKWSNASAFLFETAKNIY